MKYPHPLLAPVSTTLVEDTTTVQRCGWCLQPKSGGGFYFTQDDHPHSLYFHHECSRAHRAVELHRGFMAAICFHWIPNSKKNRKKLAELAAQKLTILGTWKQWYNKTYGG